MTSILRAVVKLFAAFAFAGMATAQPYPSKPVRLVIPFPPGGSNDVVGRVIAAQLTDRLGQTMVVENSGAGGGIVGINATAKARADGYTLLLVSVGYPVSIALNRMPLESLQWFTPVASIATGPSLLVVPAAMQVNSLMDLVALAKKKPGELNASAAGPGSFQHLATELFRLQAGIDIVIVQYKGGGPALTDTIAGQVQMNVGSVIQNLPHVRSGKLKALAVASKTRFRGLPDVPALAETLPGFESLAWFGIVAPPRTPGAIVDKVADGVREAIKLADVQKRLAELSAEPMGLTPAETAAFMRDEVERWAAVIRTAHVRPE